MSHATRWVAALPLVIGVIGAVSPLSAQDDLGWSDAFGVPGSGLNEAVTAMTVFDDDGSGPHPPALYVGGWFTTAGGISANRIARWNGSKWEPLGSGMDSYVSTLAVYDDGSGPALYAGGNFWTAGGNTVKFIAKWDGSNWLPLGGGLNGEVLSLAVFNDGAGPALYVGGEFDYAGGVYASRIAKWRNGNWSAVGGGMGGTQTSVEALTVFNDGTGLALYAGGFFHVVGNFVAKTNGWSWSPLGIGMDSTVYALTGFDDGTGPGLYAGGYFDHAGGATVNRVAKWQNAQWWPLAGGIGGGVIGSPFVWALTVYDDGTGPALYAGGHFTTAGGVPVNSIGKWNGAAWSALGSGLGGDFPFVYDQVVFSDRGGPGLYVGGTFATAGGKPSSSIARWGCPWYPRGDLNCDGSISAFDIDPFVLALTDPGGYASQFPNCSILTGDMNCDGRIDAFDIDPFVHCLVAGQCGCP